MYMYLSTLTFHMNTRYKHEICVCRAPTRSDLWLQSLPNEQPLKDWILRAHAAGNCGVPQTSANANSFVEILAVTRLWDEMAKVCINPSVVAPFTAWHGE